MRQAIPPLSKARASRIAALRQRHARRKTGLCLAEGRRVVADLLAARIPIEDLVVSSADDALVQPALVAGVHVHLASPDQWGRLTDTVAPQGVLAVLEARPADLAEVLGRPGVVVVLDGIRDPGNAGTLARTAAALGLGLVFGPATVEPGNTKAIRASAGAVLLRPPAVCHDPAALAEAVRTAGRPLLVAKPREGLAPDEAARRYPRACLVLGSEAEGPRGVLAGDAGAAVTIPMTGGLESLNVAAAGAILMYAFARARL